MSTEHILAFCAAVFLGGLVQGLSGFGPVLIMLPLLSLFLDLKTIIPLLALLTLFVSFVLLVQLRRHLSLAQQGLLFLATLPGIPVGVWALAVFPEWVISLLVAAMLLAFALYSLLASPRPRVLGRQWTVLAGFLAGILGGSTGASGPPIIVYTAIQPLSKDESKSLISGYFFFSDLVVITLHALSGLTTSRVLGLFAAGLPIILLGVWAGAALYRRLGGSDYRRIVLLLLLALGLFPLIQALTA